MPTTEITGDSVNSDTKQIDDTDSPYTTSGESIILADTTNGAVTVTLSTADATATSPENKITIIDSGTNASSNNITVNTEGAETIDGSSSFTITTDRGQTTVQSDGSDWTTNSNIEGVGGVSDGENFDGQGTSDFSNLNSVWASSVNADPTKIDDTDSPYSTSGESIIQVDTSSGAVTVTLSTSDATATSPENKLTIVDTGLNAATNNITINTEGAESINPGGNSSITITLNGGWVSVWSDGSDWFSTRAVEAQEVSTGSVGNSGSPVSFTDPPGVQEIQNDDASTNQLVPQSVFLADNAAAELFPDLTTVKTAGMLFVNDPTSIGRFNLQGGGNAVSELEDPDNAFTTASGTDGSWNLYWSGSQYEVENKTGSTNELQMWLMS